MPMNVSLEITRIESLPRREPMVARQNGDERPLQHQLEREVRVRFVTQEGDVDTSLVEALGERHRKSARHPNLDVGQLVAQDRVASASQAASVRSGSLGRKSPWGPRRGEPHPQQLLLASTQPSVIEKGTASPGQFDAAHAGCE